MKHMLLMALTAMQVVIVSAADAVAKQESPKTIPLAEARQKIDGVINGSESIASLIKQLSAADQVTFLGDVNKAVAKMPASVEERSAKHLNLNHAALKAVKGSGNVSDLLAEVFATVPPEALTVINERFASDLVNRAADPKVTYTDAQFTDIALKLMETVNKRTAETDNGSARSAFAILMLLRASNGTPEDLEDKLLETMENEEARNLAKDEWIPSALGKDDRDLGYEPILASADAGRRPDFAFTLVIAGPQFLDSILQDISGKNADAMSFIRTRSPVLDAVLNPLEQQLPTLTDGVFGDYIVPRQQSQTVPDPNPQPPQPEPRPYIGQHLCHD